MRDKVLEHVRGHLADREFAVLDVAAGLGGVEREIRLALRMLVREGALHQVDGGKRFALMAAQPAPPPDTAARVQELEREVARQAQALKDAWALAEQKDRKLDDLSRQLVAVQEEAGEIPALRAQLCKQEEDLQVQRGTVYQLQDELRAERTKLSVAQQDVSRQRQAAEQLRGALADTTADLEGSRSQVEGLQLQVMETRSQAEGEVAQLGVARELLSRIFGSNQEPSWLCAASRAPAAQSVYLPSLQKFCWLDDGSPQPLGTTVRIRFGVEPGQQKEEADAPVPEPAQPAPKALPQPPAPEQVLECWVGREQQGLTSNQLAMQLSCLGRQVTPVLEQLARDGRVVKQGQSYRLAAAAAAAPEAFPAQPPKKIRAAVPAPKAASKAAPKPRPTPAVPREVPPLRQRQPQADLPAAILRALKEAGRPVSRSLARSRTLHPDKSGFDAALDSLIRAGQVTEDVGRFSIKEGAA